MWVKAFRGKSDSLGLHSVQLCTNYMVTRLVALASFIDVGVHSHTFTLDELSDQVKTTCKGQFTPSLNQDECVQSVPKF